MADRTHSHDTSTPAMSAETVPSEEFVLVPREPTREMFVAMTWGFNVYGGLPGAYRAVIEKFAAAPTLSASHLAKEGGEAASVEPLKWARTTDPSEGSVHYGTGVFGHWYAASRVKPKVWSVNHHIDGKNVIVGLFESLQSAYAAAQSDYDCRIRAALSTPTEGPASQTEGMGGDAARVRPLAPVGEDAEQYSASRGSEWCKIFDTLRNYRMSNMAWEDGEPGFPLVDVMSRVGDTVTIADGEWEMVALADEIIAALTPPETAEAVPDDLTAAYMAGVERGRGELRAERDDAVNMAAALAEVVASSEYKLESGDRYSVSLYTANRMVDLARHLLAARAAAASDPAPATDDRERLVKALREAAAPFVRHYADWMNKWPDDQEASVFLRHTYGEIRALRAALATEASR